jgi:hypothetical protein
MPSAGVQSLRPHAIQKAATVRITRLRGVFWGSGVSSLATAGSPGYLHKQAIVTHTSEQCAHLQAVHISASYLHVSEQGTTVGDPGKEDHWYGKQLFTSCTQHHLLVVQVLAYTYLSTRELNKEQYDLPVLHSILTSCTSTI